MLAFSFEKWKKLLVKCKTSAFKKTMFKKVKQNFGGRSWTEFRLHPSTERVRCCWQQNRSSRVIEKSQRCWSLYQMNQNLVLQIFHSGKLWLPYVYVIMHVCTQNIANYWTANYISVDIEIWSFSSFFSWLNCTTIVSFHQISLSHFEPATRSKAVLGSKTSSLLELFKPCS